MIVIGIETSCDDTAAAIYDGEKGLLANLRYSQIKTHEPYGGVVPELAARDHIKKLLPLINRSLSIAGIDKSKLDGIAYTKGPGLNGALLVGASVGRSLAMALSIPSVGVHHLEGHILSSMLEAQHPAFPFITLLVSGGHTQLIIVNDYFNYQIIGETLDDAVGEAFDKTAKLLGLSYPGGPSIAKLAEKGSINTYTMPRPMTNRQGLDFSFSGLKTHVKTLYQSTSKSEQVKADIAAGFQHAVIDTLLIKTKRALKTTNLTRLSIVGGVGANQRLRQQARSQLKADVYYPRAEFCTDNGAMIAYAGYKRLVSGFKDDLSFDVKPRWPLDEINQVNSISG